MDLKHHVKENRGYFYFDDNGKKAAIIFYSHKSKDVIIITHTETNEGYEGQGLGKKLVLAVVDYARANSLKIVPECPFAKSIFDKTPEYGDVLA